MAERSAAEIAEGVDLLLGIVDAADQRILVGRPATGLVNVLAKSSIEVHEGIAFHTGHERVARLLHGRVQRNRERELLGLVGETQDLGDKTAGGDRKMACSDIERVGVVELAQSLEGGVVVSEGLALSHEDHARHTRVEIVAHVHGLLVDLTGRERAGEPVLTRRTKCATHCTTSLCRYANGELSSCGGHAHALYGSSVGKAQQILAAAVLGDLAGNLGSTKRLDAGRQRLAQRFGQVGHLIRRRSTLVPNPVLDLLGAKRRLTELLHELQELAMRDGMEVERSGGVVKVLFCHSGLPSLLASQAGRCAILKPAIIQCL